MGFRLCLKIDFLDVEIDFWCIKFKLKGNTFIALFDFYTVVFKSAGLNHISIDETVVVISHDNRESIYVLNAEALRQSV